MNFNIASFVFVVLLFACSPQKRLEKNMASADAIINKTLEVHGKDNLEEKTVNFVFRGGKYEFNFHEDRSYFYQSIKTKNGVEKKSVLTNKFFEYTENGIVVNVDERKARGLSNSLNSVIYFASLPYKLIDDSVSKKKLADQEIKGVNYFQIEVTFAQEGGGEDHDDVFHYWINKKTNQIDYFAYAYSTGKGGVRFRAAYNKTEVAGIIFQDYENYKADKSTPLNLLPAMYEKGELKLLSKIETEQVTVK